MNVKTTKRAADIYVENQANIFAKNAAEYVVYKISKERNCSIQLPFSVDLEEYYHVDVDVSYIYSDPNASGCTTSAIALTPAGEADAYAYARIDVSVTVENESVGTEPVRIFRRFIEDITPFVYHD